MKKSNKPEINSEELLKDFDKVMSFISKMENQDLTKINLESLSNRTKKICLQVQKFLTGLVVVLDNGKQLQPTVNFYMDMVYPLKYGLKEI